MRRYTPISPRAWFLAGLGSSRSCDPPSADLEYQPLAVVIVIPRLLHLGERHHFRIHAEIVTGGGVEQAPQFFRDSFKLHRTGSAANQLQAGTAQRMRGQRNPRSGA